MRSLRAIGYGATLALALGVLACAAETEPVEATAFLVPFRLLELATDVGGVVGKVHVEEGDAVKPGQVLVELKADVLKAEWAVSQARAASARAQLAAGEATYKVRQVDYERVKTLFDKKIASSEDFDKAKLEMELARLAVQNAQAQLTMYEHAARRDEETVNRTILRAPLAGEVLRVGKREGEAVAERGSLISMSCVDPLYVICNLPLTTSGRVRPSMKATLRLEHRPDPPLECTVVVADAVADAASGTYRVKLSLPNPDKTIPAGGKGTIRFILPKP